MNRLNWQDWLIGVVGLWLIASPFMLPYGPAEVESNASAATWGFLAAGLLTIGVMALGLFEQREWQLWLGIALALCVIALPWVFGFTDAAALVWSAMASGVLIGLAAVGELVWPSDDYRTPHH
ncbi:SPW repeat domain-containing protein [Histidinibacterium aquaticum]|uniref:SPW repeat-containing integral membrane domain-containing protein n=1 Tax=Histidinibacterium aquaticum TaxID=2613962 RepID=A0A5J5GM91_9RHOB|nr:hypothetical protein [Histidinibacterium aquaticum]KAA9008773.1 hypothetical protein F3S47_05765 [Histidinibacterium aquaticum]